MTKVNASDPQQTIADLRRELAQSNAERDEALARETATAEVLQVINASPGDLAPVFDAMLEKAMRLCEASFGLLNNFDGEVFRGIVARGIPGVPSESFYTPVVPDQGSASERLVLGDLVVHIPDVVETDAYRSGVASRLRLVAETGARTALWVALRKEDALLGSFVLYRQEVRPFSEGQIALLQNFAAQAVIAMENARLFHELQQRTGNLRESLEYQTATSDVLKVISQSTFDIQPVFETITATAARLCDADIAGITNREGDNYRMVATFAASPEYDALMRGRIFPANRETTTGRAALEGRIVHIADIVAEPEYTLPESVTVAKIRTNLGVPLLRDGVVVGVISLGRTRVQPFTERQIELVRTFADQAVIALENARLITETREALEQQTATAEVLEVINASPGNLAPVFDAMIDKAMRLCEAAFGVMNIFDGERFRNAARRGMPDGVLPLGGSITPEPGSALRQLVDGETIVHIADLTDTAGYREGIPSRRLLADSAGARTALLVALRSRDALLGSFVIYRQEVRPFTDKQIALLQNFAAQAVIAMENARLITETREALEQQTATAEVLGVINASPGDLAPVFDAMLEKAMRLCGGSFGVFAIYQGEHYRIVANRGLPQGLAAYVSDPISIEPGSMPDRLRGDEDIIQIPDIATVGAEHRTPGLVAMIELGHARTALWVGLRKDGVAQGFFGVYRQEIRPFTDKQIALLQNFAAQAVIAMENARLLTETREALERQTATAEVLQVINSSPGDLAPVFDAILEKAMQLCEAAFGGMALFEGDHYRVVGHRGVPAPLVDFLKEPQVLHPGGLIDRLRSGDYIIHIADLAAIEDPQVRTPGFNAMIELGGARSTLWVGLRKDAQPLGFLAIYRQEVQPFSDKQIALLQNFAAQAVIAMENARLITETREALEQQTATAEVLQVINSSPGDLAPVFDAMLEKAMRLCEATFGVLNTYDGKRFRAAASRGVPKPLGDILREPFETSPTSLNRRLLLGEAVVQTADIAADDLYQSGNRIRVALVEGGGARTGLAIALRKDETFLGSLWFYRQEVRPFTDKQIALLQNFAAQAVIAMENARLLGELRERTEEIEGWNKELEARVAAQLGEIERTGKLRRFLAPQLANLILAQGDESILESHRREIVVVFCDLRGFTAFAERAEPEEVMALLKDYHAAMGPIVAQYEGTIDHYGGDGIMVFFNDPVPTPDPARRAIDMAVAMRERAQELLRGWRRHGHDLGFGVGISQGYATLGQIGFAERMDYTAIGTVTNLAARLCAEAKNGQILCSSRVASAIEDAAELEEIGDLSLKGLSQAVAVYNVPLAPA